MHDEVQTAVLSVDASGTTEEVQLDADENRKIVGWSLSPTLESTGATQRAEAEAFIGVDPDIGIDDAEDIGGKFYASAGVVVDATNGYALSSEDNAYDIEGTPNFDWNEDAVLTLQVREGQGNASVEYTLEVYYVQESHVGGL
jgi:hypothetical protein